MKKIQVSTVRQTADVEVINVSAYLVAKIVRAQVAAKEVDEVAKQYCGKDENGKEVWEYTSIPAKIVHEQILPLLNEFIEAFGLNIETNDKEREQ